MADFHLKQRNVVFALLATYGVASILYFVVLPLVLPASVDEGTAGTLLFEMVTLNGVLLGFYSILAVGNIDRAQADIRKMIQNEEHAVAHRHQLGPAGLYAWDFFLIAAMALTAFLGLIYTAGLNGSTSRTVLDLPIVLTFSSLCTVVLRFAFAIRVGFEPEDFKAAESLYR